MPISYTLSALTGEGEGFYLAAREKFLTALPIAVNYKKYQGPIEMKARTQRQLC